MATSTTTKTRQRTICSKSFARQYHQYVFFPEIHLSGKWLQEAGFKTGQVIDIAYRPGKLVITVAREQKYVLE